MLVFSVGFRSARSSFMLRRYWTVFLRRISVPTGSNLDQGARVELPPWADVSRFRIYTFWIRWLRFAQLLRATLGHL